MSDKDHVVSIDDSVLYDAARRGRTGRDEAARNTATLDRAVAVRALRPLDSLDWLSWQLLPMGTETPVAILKLGVLGIAGITPQGEPLYAREFLLLAMLHGTASPAEADLLWLVNLTSVWHPQVSLLGHLHLATLPAEWLALADRLRDLLDYRYFHTEKHILNPSAARWALANGSRLPLE